MGLLSPARIGPVAVRPPGSASSPFSNHPGSPAPPGSLGMPRSRQRLRHLALREADRGEDRLLLVPHDRDCCVGCRSACARAQGRGRRSSGPAPPPPRRSRVEPPRSPRGPVLEAFGSVHRSASARTRRGGGRSAAASSSPPPRDVPSMRRRESPGARNRGRRARVLRRRGRWRSASPACAYY